MPRLRIRLSARWRGIVAPSMLLFSFTLNVISLCLPFMDLRSGLSTEPYSLQASVQFLWESKLYILACVVVAFSMVFPFVKLFVMTCVLFGGVRETRERRALEIVERYGKWSMLDVFLVCIMLALANDQFWIDAKPRAGLLCFTIAIMLSMTTGRYMLGRLKAQAPVANPRMPQPLWRVVVQGLLLCLLVAVLLVPFLEIDDWLLEDHPVSLLSTIRGLWASGAQALAVIAALFLIIAPALAGLVTLLWLLFAARGRHIEMLRGFALEIRRWAMLDVFALALGIFLAEGRDFVRTELSWGAILLAVLLAFYWPASTWYERRV